MSGHDAKLVPIDSLKPYPGNPRTHDLPKIRESLQRNGQYRPIVVREKTRHVLAGNGTLEAAQAEGWSEIWATYVDCDAKTARRIVLVDNRTNDLAGYDDSALVSLLQELNWNLEGTGYDSDAVEALIAEASGGGHLADTPPGARPAAPVSKPGNLWLLGDHRLLCGDSTDADLVGRLLDGASVSVLMTDPPYGVDYSEVVESRTNQKKGGWDAISGDALDDDALCELVRDALALVPAPVLFVWHPSNRVTVFLRAISAAGWKPSQQIVWVKNALVFGRADYQWRHEPCLYAKRPGGGGVDDRTQTTVWEEDKPTGEAHPTSKPVGLYARAYRNHSSVGDAVYEPFAGSGTAIIAAENLRRRCYAMEIDPGYCDVIVDRFERHTGQKAKLAK